MITTNIIHDRKKQSKTTGKGTLEVRIGCGRASYYISTGIRVRVSEWKAGQIVNRPDAATLNSRLAIIYEKISSEVNACIQDGRDIDVPEIRKKAWATIEAQSDEPVFIQWCEQQIGMLNISEGTFKHYKPLITRLTEFGHMRRWPDVTAENISNFDAWLRTIKKPISDAALKSGRRQEPLSDAAIYNYHKCLKALLNRAQTFGRIEQNPYDRLKGKFKRGERESVEYLSEAEMKAFEQVKPPVGTELDVAHDLFIFQMYTGLSYSDTQAFDIRQYKKRRGKLVHTGERIKTGVPFVSSLLPPAVRVLEKYDMQVPRINNADYNKQLKALGLMAGISTRLHSHIARHTFATYMLQNGVKIENVSKMLGHTNITQTQRYAKVLAESVHDDFDMIADKLKSK